MLRQNGTTNALAQMVPTPVDRLHRIGLCWESGEDDNLFGAAQSLDL
jgi:hypothetical protein